MVATLAVYWQVGSARFVNLDDDAYVEFQPMVNQGMRSAAVAWAFAGSHGGLWFPLTSLSHILDCELFGVQPGPMHVENLLWHTLNALLVFFVWRALTGTTWRAALVAALFSLHPLNVESVAWISERKNVLSTFFWLLGLGAYLRFVRAPSRWRYALVFGCLALALLSKPMAVTFPCTLLLLDFWPLRRWPERSWFALLREKTPLFAVVVVHGIVTILVQHSAGATDYARRWAFMARLENAIVSYVRYLGKTVWPESLSPFYAHPGSWPAWTVIGALAILVVFTALVWAQRKTRPWVAFGWLWFLGTLVPVIGLIQAGGQAMADRYAYVPLLGIFTALTWLVAELVSFKPGLRAPIAVIVAVALVVSGIFAHRQASAWQNSTSLYEHSIAGGEDNVHIRFLLGQLLLSAGTSDDAAASQFRLATRLDPTNVNAITQLALLEIKHQRFDAAQSLIEEARRLEPDNAGIYQSLGAISMYRQRTEEAVANFEQALSLSPTNAEAHRALAINLANLKRTDEAIAHLDAAARAKPWDAEAECDLAAVLTNTQRFADARRHFERALWLSPNSPRAREGLRMLDQLQRQLPTQPLQPNERR